MVRLKQSGDFTICFLTQLSFASGALFFLSAFRFGALVSFQSLVEQSELGT